MFACTLAIRLGMPPSEVLQMDNTDWVLLQAFNRFSPIGDVRGDLQAGIIAAAVTNVHVKKGKQVKPAVFMPKFGPQKPAKFDKKALFARLDSWVEKDKRNGSKHTDN